MKIRKTEFKKILKECIKEMVDEGAFNETLKTVLEESTRASQRRLTAGDIITEHNGFAQRNQQIQEQNVDPMALQARESAKALARQMSGYDQEKQALLEEVLADTAMNTFVQQNDPSSAEYKPTEREIRKEQAEFEMLTGGKGSNHWAEIFKRSMGQK